MENRHLKYEVPLTCPPLGAWEQPLLSLFSLVVVVVAVWNKQEPKRQTVKKAFVGNFDNHLAVPPSVTFQKKYLAR